MRLASEVVKQVTHKNMVTKKNMGLAILALKNHPSIESYGPYDLGDPWILTHHIFNRKSRPPLTPHTRSGSVPPLAAHLKLASLASWHRMDGC